MALLSGLFLRTGRGRSADEASGWAGKSASRELPPCRVRWCWRSAWRSSPQRAPVPRPAARPSARSPLSYRSSDGGRRMKITDVTLTLFSWESIPSTIYGGPPLPPPPAIRRLRRTQPFAEFEARCLGRRQGPMVCRLFPGASRIRTISTAQDPQHFCGVCSRLCCLSIGAESSGADMTPSRNLARVTRY
jgi:hypothetical protein